MPTWTTIPEYKIIYFPETMPGNDRIQKFNALGREGWWLKTALAKGESVEYIFERAIMEQIK